MEHIVFNENGVVVDSDDDSDDDTPMTVPAALGHFYSQPDAGRAAAQHNRCDAMAEEAQRLLYADEERRERAFVAGTRPSLMAAGHAHDDNDVGPLAPPPPAQAGEPLHALTEVQTCILQEMSTWEAVEARMGEAALATAMQPPDRAWTTVGRVRRMVAQCSGVSQLPDATAVTATEGGGGAVALVYEMDQRGRFLMVVHLRLRDAAYATSGDEIKALRAKLDAMAEQESPSEQEVDGARQRVLQIEKALDEAECRIVCHEYRTCRCVLR